MHCDGEHAFKLKSSVGTRVHMLNFSDHDTFFVAGKSLEVNMEKKLPLIRSIPITSVGLHAFL